MVICSYKRWMQAILLLLPLTTVAADFDVPGVWLLVETQPHVLSVMKGDEVVAAFPKIAIGRRGAGLKQHRGDNLTPIGHFRIGWINENSRFRRFFGFTYPNFYNAKRALEAGLIDGGTFERIAAADLAGGIPPQNTALGGQIGIHGLGSGSAAIHENFDWTQGCIALSNEQIDRLAQYVKPGTWVVIR